MKATNMSMIISFSFMLIIPFAIAQQQQCLTNADNNPCDGIIDVSELNAHINAWYACSSCVPDLFNALQGFLDIPFCGDWSCNATIGEDCSSCQQDCGNCSVPGPTIPQDYVAYWKFDGDTTDETGNNDGTWIGGAETYSPGQVGQALNFSMPGDYVDLGHFPGIENQQAITISAWVKPADPLASKFLSNLGSGDDTLEFYRHTGNENVEIRLYNTANVVVIAGKSDAIPSADTNWHHVAATYDGTNVCVYVDNIIGNFCRALTGNTQITDNSLSISSSSGSWNGLIDEVIIYNRSLSAAEIQQIYAAQGGLGCTDDPGCSAAGSNFCDSGTNTPYTCTLNSTDGCLDRTDGAACIPGLEVCSNGACVPSYCSGINACADYNQTGCPGDSCSKSTTVGCEWNASTSMCEDMPDPCAVYTQCSQYADQQNCTNNACGVGTTGCAWNTSTGICEDAILQPNAIYVDNQLAADCIGSYDVGSRSCGSGSEIAYSTPQAAADATAPGDIVYFRNGTYYEQTTTRSAVPVMHILTSGTVGAPITYKNYNNEVVILDAFNPSNGARKYRTIQMGIPPAPGQGVQNVIIDGLIVEGAGYTGLEIYGPADQTADPPNPTENVIIRNVIARYNTGGASGFGIHTAGTLINVTIENCEAYENAITGIEFGRISRAYHAAEPENRMSAARYSTIRNCLSYNNNNPANPAHTDGISTSNAYRSTVEDNVVFGNSDDGMDIYSSLEVTVKNNIIFNHNTAGGNGAGLKFSAGGGGRHFVEGNTIFNNDGFSYESSAPSGEYIPYYASRMYNNLAYNGSTGFSLGYSYNPYPGIDIPYLRNNIGLDNVNNDLYPVVSGWIDSDYNFFSNSGNLASLQVIGQDANSLGGDPGIVNKNVAIDTNFGSGWTFQQKLDHIRSQVNSSFVLNSTSQLIDKGTVVPGYHCTESDDLGNGASQTNCRHWNGAAPDIGAIEY
jgi:parallel beta-helix repeat protein